MGLWHSEQDASTVVNVSNSKPLAPHHVRVIMKAPGPVLVHPFSLALTLPSCARIAFTLTRGAQSQGEARMRLLEAALADCALTDGKCPRRPPPLG